MSQAGVYKWSMIDRVGNSVMTFGGNVVLARLLDPNDFGLLAMVAIFIALASNISSCGMADSLIHDSDVTDKDYSTVFVFNAVMGLLFSVAFIAFSDTIAVFFGHPQLENIMWAIGICFFFQMMCLTQETKLRKELEMKKMAFVHLSATASAVGLGILLAVRGYSYWALVSTRVFLSFFQFLYFVIATRWIPRFAFYMDSFRRSFGYGVHLMLAYLCSQFSRNINMSILGKYGNASSAGLYSQAQKLEEVPFGLSESILNWPFFAVVSKEGDPGRQRVLINTMHSTVLFVNLLIVGLLLAVATPAFHLLYGERWDAAIPVFHILVIYGGFTAVKYFYQTVLKVYARTAVMRNLTFFEVGLQLAMLAYAYDKGLNIIALTQLGAVCVAVVIYIGFYKRLLNLSFARLIKSFASPLLIAVAACVAAASVACVMPCGVAWLATLGVMATFAIVVIIIGRITKFAPYMALAGRLSQIWNKLWT